MAKKEVEKVIDSVKLKDETEVITTRNGMVIDKDNLTIERYLTLIGLSESFKDKFIVKLTNKKDEQINEGAGS